MIHCVLVNNFCSPKDDETSEAIHDVRKVFSTCLPDNKDQHPE